jgi:hypothetical protein
MRLSFGIRYRDVVWCEKSSTESEIDPKRIQNIVERRSVADVCGIIKNGLLQGLPLFIDLKNALILSQMRTALVQFVFILCSQSLLANVFDSGEYESEKLA